MKKLSLALFIFSSSLFAQVQLGKNVQIGFGSGTGAGTVAGGTTGQFAQYPASGTTVQGATLSGDGSLAVGGDFTLSTVNNTPGTCGDSTHIPQFVVNGKGLTTSCTQLSLPTPFAGSNGIVFNTSNTTSRNAIFSDIVPLWGGGTCAGYLKSDGTCGSGGSSITLQTNGANNSSQSTLNLQSGSGIAVTNTSGGNVSISSQAAPYFDSSRATLWDVFDLHEGSGTTLTGIVNGHTCTLAGQTGSDPVWSGQSLVFGSATTSFITCTGMTDPVLFQVIASYIPVASPQYQTFAGVDAAVTNGFYFTQAPPPVATTPQFDFNLSQAGRNPAMGAVGNAVQALTVSMGANSYGYIDNNSLQGLGGASSFGNIPPPTGANFTVGGSLGQSGCAPHACQFHSGSIYGFAVYSTQPSSKAATDALVAQNENAWHTLLLSHGVTLGSYVNNNPSTVTALICLGTSIEAGTGSGIPVCATSVTGLSTSYTPFNLGVPSSFLSALVGGNSQVALYGNVPTAARRIVYHGNAATNDMALGSTTPANAYSLLQQAVSQDSIVKPAYIIVGTQMSRVGQDTNKNAWNALVRAGASNTGYRLCDIAASPLLGADGAYANTTYFVDGIHPTATGQAIQGGILGSCIAYFDGATPASPTLVTANSYTITPTDAYINWTPTGPATGTLPECIGLTGDTFSIENSSSSTLNSILISAAGSETIVGGNIVAPLTTVTYKVQLIGPTTGGCRWVSSPVASGLALIGNNNSWASSQTFRNGFNVPSGTNATSGSNSNSPSTYLCGSFWNGSVGTAGNDCWSFIDTLGTGTNPTSTFSISHAGSPGAASVSVPALSVNSSQALTGVQGTAGTNVAAASGTFTNGNLRATNSTGDAVDSGIASTNVPLLNASNTFTGPTNTFSNGVVELNSSGLEMLAPAATSGTPTVDGDIVNVHGSYWNGSASVDSFWTLRNVIGGSGAGITSKYTFTQPSSCPPGGCSVAVPAFQITKQVVNDVGLQIATGAGCTISAGAIGGTCMGTMTLPVIEPDTSYNITGCSVVSPASGPSSIGGLSSLTTTGFTFTQVALGTASTGGGTVECTVTHN